jgi:membrane protease YdiL (CAAX protease family)
MKDTLGASANENAMSGRSLAAEYGAYVTVTYLITWTLLIFGVKHGWSVDYLNVSGAGPAITALILSRRRILAQPTRARWPWFIGFLALSWVVVCLNSSWQNSSGGLPIHLNALLLIPAVAPTWILSSALSADQGVRALGRRLLCPPDRWSIYAFFFFPVLWGIPSAIAYALGARLAWPDMGGVTHVSIAIGAMFFFNNFLFAGIQEEPGWRGFLLDRLQRRFSPLSASLLVWLPWALWHGPVDYYRPVRFSLVQEILLRVVTMIPMTIILTWFCNRSGRSIQTVVIFHACMNTFPYIFAYCPAAWFVVFIFSVYAVVADRMWSHGRGFDLH